MREFVKCTPDTIEQDFKKRVEPSLQYSKQIGNLYSASVYLALSSLLDNVELNKDNNRLGVYSYGSGCSSEFYSGLISPYSKTLIGNMEIQKQLDRRYPLTMAEYENLLDLNMEWIFGIKDKEVNFSDFSKIYEHCFAGQNKLVLKRITNYHREYEWS